MFLTEPTFVLCENWIAISGTIYILLGDFLKRIVQILIDSLLDSLLSHTFIDTGNIAPSWTDLNPFSYW
jgi:hypothetical protein